MTSKLNINENFICRIWEAGEQFYSNLFTTENEPVEVKNYGSRNYDSGPDYTNTKIRIGSKLYTGDVEVHRDFKSWEEHSHHKDRKYNTVILQVVLWDSPKRYKPKLRIKRDVPTVILSHHLNYSIHDIWREIINNPSPQFKLPCYDNLNSIDDTLIETTFSELSMERLNSKTRRIRDSLNELHMDKYGHTPEYDKIITKLPLWEQSFYEHIFEALGYSRNKEPMMRLAKNVKLTIIKNAMKRAGVDEHVFVQSLLFGFGGLLFDLRISNEYVSTLKNTWNDLNKRIQIEHLNKADWHFFRMRPQNFPTVRLAYGSQIVLRLIKEELFKNVVLNFMRRDFNVKRCYKNISHLLASDEDVYWSYNYNFGKSLKKPLKLLGKQRMIDIVVNVVIPFVYYYSVVFNDKVIKNNVLQFYNSLKINPENSVLSVIKEQLLKDRSIKIDTPAAEQAAIQLYNFYCVKQRCETCNLGRYMVKEKGFDYRIIFY